MIKTRKSWKPTLVKLGLFLLVIFMFPASVMAQGIPVRDTVEKGQVLDQNVVLSGPVVVMDGVVNGDLVAVGGDVTINGPVNGSLIIAAKNAAVNGPVTGSIYAAAPALKLGAQSNTGRDVNFIGGRLEMPDGSTIQRDLNMLSLETALAGKVDRQVNAVVGPINLFQRLYSLITGTEFNPENLFPRSQVSPSNLAFSGIRPVRAEKVRPGLQRRPRLRAAAG